MGFDQIVRVKELKVSAYGLSNPVVTSGRLSRVGLPEVPHARVLFRVTLNNFCRVVSRSIVDDDALPVFKRLRSQAVQCGSDEVSIVVRGNNDAYQRT